LWIVVVGQVEVGTAALGQAFLRVLRFSPAPY